jgi:hypothetical protein
LLRILMMAGARCGYADRMVVPIRLLRQEL